MSVKSTVETLSPTRVRLQIEVPFAEIEPSLKKAYREVAQQVSIPGFRRGKVPAAVIDQRIGREAVLNEAVQEIIPQQLVAALQQHQVRSLGRPQVDNLEFDDGAPLTFTAEVDVRPEINLPELGDITVTVDEIQITDEEIDQQVSGLRDRFATLKTVERAAQQGDYVQIDLVATVDGQPVEGGTASNISHEVGSQQLLPGLDEVLVGMSAGDETTFVTPLVAGDHAGRDADVAVTLRTVKEKELPPLDDDFAQLASEFDTLAELRADVRERLGRIKRAEQLYQARDRALDELVERSGVPAPEGVVQDEVEHRKAHLSEELERMGRSLPDYLAMEGKTEQEFDTDLAASAAQGLKVQMVLDALAEAEEVQVSDDEFGQEVVARAQRAGMEPQKYYDELVRAGAAAQVHGEVRRNKALGRLIEQITITDTAGNPVSTEVVSAQATPVPPAAPAP
jgi:trigger factor